jgi:hypothetical protein
MAKAVIAYFQDFIPYARSCSETTTVDNIYYIETTLINNVHI